MQMLTTRELAERLGVGELTLRRWRKRGALPPPIRLPGRRLGWPREEIESWLASRPRAGERQ
jgi:excisionase family DNA binding protein